MRVALISEHASPLAAAGGVDAGGVHRVRTLFTWQRVASQLAQVYAELRRPQHLPQRALLSLVPRAGVGIDGRAVSRRDCP